MKSIIQDKQECYVSKRTDCLENHHIFAGRKNRKISDKYGLTIWLNNKAHYEWHNSPPNIMYITKTKRQQIQQMAQRKAMEHYGWTVEDFRKLFGKSFI